MSISSQNFNQREMFLKTKNSKMQQDMLSQSMAQPQNNFSSSKVYYPNESVLNQTAPQLFRDRSGKLKWKEILRIDLDSMTKTNDLTPVEPLLDNLVFANIDENDMQVMPDVSVVKLVKTYQYILEYLLYVQQKKESENRMYEENYRNLINDSTIKENILKENKSMINTLKKDNKQKEQIITTYKYLLDEYKRGNMEVVVPKPQSYECAICEDKKFINKESLIKHYQRRHPKTNYANDIENQEETNKFQSQTIPVRSMNNFASSNMTQAKNHTLRDQEKYLEIEKNIENMKSQFETVLKSNMTEHYNKLYETQKSLEHNVMELKGDKSKLVQIEMAMNKMMKKLSKLKEKTKDRERETVNAVNISTPMSEKFKEESFIQHTEKLNQQITDVYRYNNQKIDKISENLEEFKKIIMSQLEEASKKNRSNVLKEQIDYNKEDTKRTAHNNELLFQNVEKLDISRNFEREAQHTSQEANNNYEIKRRFNASRNIESDHSDEERKREVHSIPERSRGEEKPQNLPEKAMSRQYTQPPSDFSKSNKAAQEKESSSLYSPKKAVKVSGEDDTLEELTHKLEPLIPKQEPKPDSKRDAIRGKIASAFTLKEGNKEESYLSQGEKNKIKEEISSITETLKQKETEEQIAEKMDHFYFNFGKREDDLYMNKLKMDNYYQVKNSDYQVKEEILQFIQSSINDKLISWNQETNINLEDLSEAQTETIHELIRNIKEETKSKCENNPYYKIYFEKLIAELKLEEYLKVEKKPALGKSQYKELSRDQPKISFGPSSSKRENDELANLKREMCKYKSKLDNKVVKKQANFEDDDFEAFGKKTKAMEKLDNDEFDY